jgi:hypothetical protein
MTVANFALTACLSTPAIAGKIGEVIVPGRASPWLAGMPDGALGCGAPDQAPDESPILVANLRFEANDALTFTVSGFTCHCAGCCSPNPDGGAVYCLSCSAINGIGTLCAPLNSLIGVFLDAEQPDSTPAPPGMDFNDPASRDYLSLAPQLKQVFFIGDGRTSLGAVQQIYVPAGATRLYLGSNDGFGWYDNTGEMVVTVAIAENCVPADVNCDGAVNVDDLLTVINNWGSCDAPCSPACIADIAPAGGNCAVDVDDLLTVINNWG